jgi:hypothetical protein
MAFKLYNQITNEELPSMDVEGVNAFLKDFSVSEDTDKPSRQVIYCTFLKELQ